MASSIVHNAASISKQRSRTVQLLLAGTPVYLSFLLQFHLIIYDDQKLVFFSTSILGELEQIFLVAAAMRRSGSAICTVCEQF
jgi:hypothetical protein